jgi:glycosyltransferase involved in cell wall biosynthesis
LEAAVRAAADHDDRIVAEIAHIPLDRKDELFRRAALVVLPYTSFASQSAVLGDAYSYRRPAIVTDVGSLAETVRTDGTGWVVPASDPTALAEALLEAIRDPTKRKGAAESTAVAATARSPERVGMMIRKVYEKALG